MTTIQKDMPFFLAPASLEPDTLHAQKLVLFRQESSPHLRPLQAFLETTQTGYIHSDHRRYAPCLAASLAPEYLLSRHQQLSSLFHFESTEAFHAINYIDRVCSIHPVHLSRYQTLGTACFLIACKLCEPHPPTCQDIVRLAPLALDFESLKAEELLVLKRLKWDLTVATPSAFLELFMTTMPLEHEVHRSELFMMADAFLAAIQCIYYMLRYKPSVQACAAVLVAAACLDLNCSVFFKHFVRELNQLSMDMSAVSMGLQVPLLREVEACANDMSCVVRQAFPEFSHVKSPSDLRHAQPPQPPQPATSTDPYWRIVNPGPAIQSAVRPAARKCVAASVLPPTPALPVRPLSQSHSNRTARETRTWKDPPLTSPASAVAISADTTSIAVSAAASAYDSDSQTAAIATAAANASAPPPTSASRLPVSRRSASKRLVPATSSLISSSSLLSLYKTSSSSHQFKSKRGAAGSSAAQISAAQVAAISAAAAAAAAAAVHRTTRTLDTHSRGSAQTSSVASAQPSRHHWHHQQPLRHRSSTLSTAASASAVASTLTSDTDDEYNISFTSSTLTAHDADADADTDFDTADRFLVALQSSTAADHCKSRYALPRKDTGNAATGAMSYRRNMMPTPTEEDVMLRLDGGAHDCAGGHWIIPQGD
ncbi:hypothetical protein BC831DRAFT_463193 [Entophlyctis helioformis]|nr:hypothetical protein BC831DRAFT_463193 [Entophlyctis helioformis]